MGEEGVKEDSWVEDRSYRRTEVVIYSAGMQAREG